MFGWHLSRGYSGAAIVPELIKLLLLELLEDASLSGAAIVPELMML